MIGFPATIGRGFGGSGTVTAPAGDGLLALARQHTLDLIDKWGEVLTIKRRNVIYDDTGMSSVNWVTVGTFNGDWQPLAGSTGIEEKGMVVRSTSQIFAAYDAIVLAGDRIYRVDGSYEYINYVKEHEDHTSIRMKLAEQQ